MKELIVSLIRVITLGGLLATWFTLWVDQVVDRG